MSKKDRPVFDFSAAAAPSARQGRAIVSKQAEQEPEEEEDDEEEEMMTLEPEVMRRVKALKGLHSRVSELEQEFHKEYVELERKYELLYAPHFTKRAAIVNGEYEPTDEEIPKPEEGEEEEKEEEKEDDPDRPKVVGIPGFWLGAMLNHVDVLAEMIQEHDHDALMYMSDLVSTKLALPDEGFRLDFHFKPNPFFSNAVLSKTYYTTFKDNFLDMDRYEVTPIEWKAGKDLTRHIVRKKGKGARGKKAAPKSEAQPSFFRFFESFAQKTKEAASEAEIEFELESDFEVASILDERLVRRAVNWFTGEEASGEDGEDDEYEPEAESGDEEDAGDDDEDEDDDDGYSSPANKAGKGETPTECAQQQQN